MPRKERTVSRSMVAAAKSFGKRKVDQGDEDAKSRGGEEWMRLAWDYYDMIGEYRQAPTIQGALLSRAKLTVEELVDGKWVLSKNKTALAVLAELYGGPEGQSEMLRLFGVNFTVTGGCWLVSPAFDQIPDADTDDWQIVAETEIRKGAGGEWMIHGKPNLGDRLRIHIWRAHAKDPKRSDSATRPTLPVLSQLLQLRKRTSAQIDSRLTGGGVWLLPSETEFPAAPTRQVVNTGEESTVRDGVAAGDAQGMADMIMDAASAAIERPETAEAMLPIIATVPGEYLKEIKPPINFWSDLDKSAPALRKELIESLAQGMDIPPDVLLSGRNSNHWNAWLSDESNTKIHAEPTLQIVSTGLTDKYFRPALDGLVPDPKKFRIGTDTSQMRLRPNRSAEATELNDRLILSDEAVLRENGFTDEDMMDDEGVKKAIARKAAIGQTTPEMIAWVWRQLGIDVPVTLADPRGPSEARPTPSLDGHPTRNPPSLPPSTEKSGGVEQSGGHEKASGASADIRVLTLVSEQIVDRALQRAGNRIKQKYGIKEPPSSANRLYLHVNVTTADLDDLLADAWDGCHLGDYGIPAAELARALDIYSRACIMAHREPTRDTLSAALELLLRRQAA